MREIHPVVAEPFPHVLAHDYLDARSYRALASSFPDCAPNSGPTGYTCFWGDPDYDALIAGNPAWAALFRRFHSQAFVAQALAQFAGTFEAECLVDLSHASYVPYRESRAEKEQATLAPGPHAPEKLWVRLDIMQGRIGYERRPHLDHARRAVSLLLYLSDAAETDMMGGELVLHAANGAPAAIIPPRHNLMVMFPCTPGSVHSVRPILSQRSPRNFIQVTLSSSVDLWRRAPARPMARLGSVGRAALARVARAIS